MEWISESVPFLARRFNQSDDGRIGAARNGSTNTGTLSTYGVDSSGSLKGLGSTFVPVSIILAICLAIFLVNRPKQRRVYAPRTIESLRRPENTSPQLPDGWFNWIRPFFAIDQLYILNNCSLDGFFFLRYLRVLAIICLVGCCLTWPIILPIHGTGKIGLKGLDQMTIGNIMIASRYYAHVVIAWCFFGFVLFMITRECIYYINLRQAYLLSPNHSKRLSSRTVLFTCIPRPYRDEEVLGKLFGDSAKNIWLLRNTNYLRGLVNDREEVAVRLEQAEIKLIRKANAARDRVLKRNPPPPPPPPTLTSKSSSGSSTSPQDSPTDSVALDAEKAKNDGQMRVTEQHMDSPRTEVADEHEYEHPYGFDPSLPDVRGSVAAQWLPAKARPHHRPIQNFGRRVDTIRWTRARLKALNRDIWKLRKKHRGGDGTPLDAAFIEFDSQTSAQVAFQTLAHHQPLHMSPRFIGIRPEEVIWSSLRMKWWERIMRRFLMFGAIASGIIFWSIPAAFIGTLSNIDRLTDLLPFLGFINLLPGAILGVIKGFLPALALTWLMAIVPKILRGCARVAGVPSHAHVELFVQTAYFAFQVVQVFLVTTLVRAASDSLQQVIKDPLSIKELLSANLPTASNFYLSYILLQCIGSGALELLNIVDLWKHAVVTKFATDPRKQFRRWDNLKRIHWGSVYPKFTNLAVIALSYSCIAPLILVFAGLGMCFVYVVYRYNLIYVYESDYDTQGLFYPTALMQLMWGLYIAEVCMIGLFALKSGFGPLLLMVLFLVFSILVHISLHEAVTPLLYNLPRTLAREKDVGPIIKPEAGDQDPSAPRPDDAGGLAAAYYDEDEHFGDEPEPPPLNELDTDIQMRGIEGSSSLKYMFLDLSKGLFRAKLKNDVKDSGLTRILTQVKVFLTPDPTKKHNFIIRWFHPEIYQDFRALQSIVNPGPEDVELPDDYARKAYWPPEMWRPAPRLWIPKDEARVSRQEVAHTKESVFISDQGCWLQKKGRVACDCEVSPLKEPRILY
ncbi:hypothetical protein QBC37DRAFT_81513 [Rhypophila decipiens]|uniref:DUF221-domain-containing protein n=1 Tax=Rhypophila decipiens TaxID=261697 RepID=A0AAN6Y104_9PEZI|nr:hypothetical protein QBC37DRAFT_81513 [Rhypophila decipiens]